MNPNLRSVKRIVNVSAKMTAPFQDQNFTSFIGEKSSNGSPGQSRPYHQVINGDHDGTTEGI